MTLRYTRVIGVNPARAGMIPAPSDPTGVRRRKPRACGDDPSPESGHDLLHHVNPACAGMIRKNAMLVTLEQGKPCVCGDDPFSVVSLP